MQTGFLFIVALIFYTLSITAQSNELQSNLMVGAAKVKMTPPVGSIIGDSYGIKVSTGVHDDLHIKTLVFQNSGVRQVGNIVAAEAYKVYQTIQYQNWIPLSSVQREFNLAVRLPEKMDIDRAKGILAKLNGSEPDTQEEAYAHETIMLSKYPKTVPLILQAFRLGDLAITSAPCEVFVEIGLEIKEKSPYKPTFMISLANGYNGYLPTPEHHKFGGYETWRARSSYLEVNASTRITQNIFEMLAELKSEKP